MARRARDGAASELIQKAVLNEVSIRLLDADHGVRRRRCHLQPTGRQSGHLRDTARRCETACSAYGERGSAGPVSVARRNQREGAGQTAPSPRATSSY